MGLERPVVPAKQRFAEKREELTAKPLGERFRYIHETNLWGSEESRSGLGSELQQTAGLREAIPKLLVELGARTLLDIPCGDFGWLSAAELEIAQYIGGDIVPEIVAANVASYGGPRRRFEVMDLTRDALPRADVVLCRDCLVHLSSANALRALENIRASGCGYLLATTFLRHDRNEDIEDGDWRLLNLCLAPFSLPEPLRVIVEGCTESGGAYADKALGLWSAGDLEVE